MLDRISKISKIIAWPLVNVLKSSIPGIQMICESVYSLFFSASLAKLYWTLGKEREQLDGFSVEPVFSLYSEEALRQWRGSNGKGKLMLEPKAGAQRAWVGKGWEGWGVIWGELMVWSVTWVREQVFGWVFRTCLGLCPDSVMEQRVLRCMMWARGRSGCSVPRRQLEMARLAAGHPPGLLWSTHNPPSLSIWDRR